MANRDMAKWDTSFSDAAGRSRPGRGSTEPARGGPGRARPSPEQCGNVAGRKKARAVAVPRAALPPEHEPTQPQRPEQQNPSPLGVADPAVLREVAQDPAQVLDTELPAVRRAPDVRDLGAGEEQ